MKAIKYLATFALVAGVSHANAADLGAATTPAAPAPFFFVNDTQISIWYQSNAKEPGVFTAAKPNGVSITKGVVRITHFDAWQYGTNFVNIDFLKSNNNDPSTGSAIGTGDGALEVYGFYRGTLSMNAMLGTKALTVPGVIKDVSFAFGFDANTKNTLFGPQKRDVVLGATLSFDVPGVLNVSALMYKEWNHCGIGPGICVANASFNTVPKIESNYMFPLTFTGLPLKFSGFANLTWPKGKDPFQQAGLPCCKTTTEFFTQNRLTLDLGKVIADKPNSVDLFVGWQFWNNKFGNNHKLAPNGGSRESQFIAGLAWHAL